MKNVISILLLISRFIVIAKVIYLLFVSHNNVQNHINELLWWSSLLIFDVWIMKISEGFDEKD